MKKQNNKTTGYIVAIIVAFCCVCGFIAFIVNMTDPQTNAAAPNPNATAQPVETIIALTAGAAQAQTQAAATAEPILPADPIEGLKQQITNTLGEGNRSLPRLTEFDWSESDKSLIIKWAINDNLFADSILVGAKIDITDMLRVIATSGLLPDYSFVTFVGTFPLRDQFGNVSEDRVITANYNKSTVDKINWDNFLSADVLDIADLSNVHPAMLNP